ncbi:MAG TPA: hypothetical protein VNH11_06550 [Pirellulales bacterium]|nr:hypothetical protein [Pirellulales bacterium]
MLERLSPECAPPSGTGSSEWAMAEVVDEVAARLQRGERVDVEQYVAQHPQWAERDRSCMFKRIVPRCAS